MVRIAAALAACCSIFIFVPPAKSLARFHAKIRHLRDFADRKHHLDRLDQI
ncbi:Hypothetical protein AT6N2_L1491 [Agrobacterium tumefaciens]|nr:Hypothetical protein AT6N2_L1491 [Agrobacterium tumefaciens]